MKMTNYSNRETGEIKSVHRVVNDNWERPALLFEYDTSSNVIQICTTGGGVIFTSKEAGELVSLLLRRFPGLVLDALGNV